jgi:hypothetical protein
MLDRQRRLASTRERIGDCLVENAVSVEEDG